MLAETVIHSVGIFNMAKKSKKSAQSAGKSTATEIRFDYIKSPYFRVLHVDGAYGGSAPRGKNIHMSVYNERQAIPLQEVYPITKTVGSAATLGSKPTEVTRRQAIVREVETDLVFDLNTAKSIIKWLSIQVKTLEAKEKQQ